MLTFKEFCESMRDVMKAVMLDKGLKDAPSFESDYSKETIFSFAFKNR